MQEVEATCSRLVILRRGRLAAMGSVHELIANRSGGARYVVEIEGDGAVAALASLGGVTSHTAEPVDGRARIELLSTTAEELRPRIFELARDRGWTLWELHREKASLEEMFRTLTADASEEDDDEGGAADERSLGSDTGVATAEPLTEGLSGGAS
jgi:ABC-2 type transport system ATP-binding protein